MRRGTTPTHRFTLPFDVPEGAKIRIVYAQQRAVILEKTTDECSTEGNCITVRLSSDDTLRFDARKGNERVEIQVGIETPAGDKMWSDIIQATAERCLRKDGVIADG